MNIKDRYIVVDDFCEEVDAVIKSVHDAGFSTWLPNKGLVGTSVYEGMGFMGYHALMIRALINATGKIAIPNSMFFRNTQVGMEKAYIHSDRQMGDHTCVAYLSEHSESYGTAFYRHIPTGLIEMPSFLDMIDMGIMDQMSEDMVSRDPAVWEQIDMVEGKFNRAVIFDAPLFHSRFPVEGIGSTEEEARLIWASHYYELLGDGSLV